MVRSVTQIISLWREEALGGGGHGWFGAYVVLRDACHLAVPLELRFS